MNLNLFSQLENQAVEYARSVCNSAGNYVTVVDGEEVVFTFNAVIRQKLVELVVKECVSVCEDMDGVDNFEQYMHPRTPRYDCAIEIKEHFGVK